MNCRSISTTHFPLVVRNQIHAGQMPPPPPVSNCSRFESLISSQYRLRHPLDGKGWTRWANFETLIYIRPAKGKLCLLSGHAVNVALFGLQITLKLGHITHARARLCVYAGVTMSVSKYNKTRCICLSKKKKWKLRVIVSFELICHKFLAIRHCIPHVFPSVQFGAIHVYCNQKSACQTDRGGGGEIGRKLNAISDDALRLRTEK